MSVRQTDRPSWKIVKRLLLEKYNRYFVKPSQWLLLMIIIVLYVEKKTIRATLGKKEIDSSLALREEFNFNFNFYRKALLFM